MKTIRIGPIAALALILMGSPGFARTPVGDPAQKLAELREKRDTAMSEWEAKLRAAKDQEEGQKIWAARPGAEFLAGFKAIAVEAKGTETAGQAWLDVFQLAIDLDATDDAKSAVDAVVADHVASPDLVGFASMLGYASQSIGRDKAVTALNALIEKSPHRTVKAPALFSLGSLLTERGTAEEKATGRKALERVVAEFADVKPKRGGPYAERAKAYLFELDHLQVGMVAPNFESIDENGNKLSVAEYKGKVVVLDFWGHW